MSDPDPDAMFWLRHNPDTLTRINQVREQNRLDPIGPSDEKPQEQENSS